MKRILILISLLTSCSLVRSYAQQADSVRRAQIIYLGKLLKTDSVTARKASDIQDNYKQALKLALNNGSLTVQQKRTLIDSLMNEKNRKLEELLPEMQRNLIIPTTERRRTWKRDTTAKTNW